MVLEFGYAARVLTLQLLDEYFGVSVTSVAMDGAAPELSPGWAHRRTNTCPKVRHAPQLASSKMLKRLEWAAGYRPLKLLFFVT